MPVIKEKWNISLGARSSYSDWLLRRIPDEDLMNSNAGFTILPSIARLL
jgi:hypothetical protein